MQTLELNPQLPFHRRRIERFLAANGLRYDDMDYYVAIGDEDSDADDIIAGGGLKGGIIKCVAVADGHKGEMVANTIVSHLITHAHQEGHQCVWLFTKPANRRLFESLSFRLIAEAPEAVLMETGIERSEWSGCHEDSPNYIDAARGSQDGSCDSNEELHGNRKAGAIVMNCNPFTLGHLHLIEEASRQVTVLYVLPVLADCSTFSYIERKAMIEAATAHIANVCVMEGSEYVVSAATFPTYFLKRLDSASDTQMTLDLDLFRRRIAPRLSIGVRFVGSEPTDPLTARYNAIMRRMLPQVVEVPRLCIDGVPVSASLVRQSLIENRFPSAARLVPPSTLPYLIAHLATRAMKAELNTTPKPGLVDCHDNGAHKDMNHQLMARSIRALHPYFTRLSLMGYAPTMPTAHDVQQVGIEAEHAMLASTGGVNTYRGALFAMGLAVVAVAHAVYAHKPLLATTRKLIMQLAADITSAHGTHGADAIAGCSPKVRLKGALDNAREGYPQLFDTWLPFYASKDIDNEPFAMHKTLLRIMCDLDDTNIVHRAGLEALNDVKAEALSLLQDFSETGLEQMNARFIERNVSPGGSADMLALTVFLYSFSKK